MKDWRRGLGLLLLGAMAWPATVAAQTRPGGCPDIAGHYRVAEFGSALGDALNALNARSAGFTGSEVKITGRPETGLGVHLKSGGSGAMPANPNFVLMSGVDFQCKNGWLVLARSVESSRKFGETWAEGRSVVSLAPAAGGGLRIESSFSGSERTTLYSYDSARISVPKLGTGRRLSEIIRWPDITEPYAAPVAVTEPAREPKAVAQVRRMLDTKVLGPVMLGGLKERGDAVAVTLKPPKSDDAVRLEDRLREAAIPYEVKVSPVWSDRTWHMELLVWPPGAGVTKPWKPSVHRVEHELRKFREPTVEVQRVEAVGDTYVATLRITGQRPVDGTLERLKTHSTMFSEIELLKEVQRTDPLEARVAQVRLRVR
jgi:hypothetical protein